MPDICRKIVIFYTPLHSTPPLGVPRRNIVIPFGVENIRMVSLPDSEKTLKICVTV